MNDCTLLNSTVPELPLLGRGKVRDIYDLDDALLIVATDRISCFDVVLPTPIPNKGRVLTPDTSRFWPAADYAPGRPQPSFDKQYMRDYLEGLRWDKRPPAPPLPTDVVRKTAEKYGEALQRLTGSPLPSAPGRVNTEDSSAA